MLYDAIIIGGGPAGLSAALILGRCLRNVLVFDSGKPRNLNSKQMHGYLSRDGISPSEFLNISRNQIEKYETITIRAEEVTSARAVDEHFEVGNLDGQKFYSKKLLLSPGVVDDLPKIQNLKTYYGKSVFHCVYCDAWEVRNQALVAYGKGKRGYHLALSLLHWSQDLVLCTDGPCELETTDLETLKNLGISIREEKIKSLEGEGVKMERIIFENGQSLERQYLFFNTGSYIKSEILEQLGCPFSHEDGVPTGKYDITKIPGLYAAGNVLREVQLVIVAAAEGAEAAFGIHSALLKEELAQMKKTKTQHPPEPIHLLADSDQNSYRPTTVPPHSRV